MADPTRVVIVEDIPSDAELAERMVTRALGECEFRRVQTRQEYLDALDNFDPILIISDYNLPAFDGLGALELARERAPEVPFIILTGSLDEDTAVECMKAGAWDYVIKERIKRLGPAIRRAMDRRRVELERKLAQDQLRASEERYRALFERSRDLVFLLDGDGRFLDANDAALTALGSDRNEITTLTLASFLDESEHRRALEALREIRDTGRQSVPREFRAHRTDGSELYIEATGSAIRSNDAFAGVLSIARDITERKRAEAERARLEEQLRTSQKLEAIGSLAGGVAHDFNNLLSVILSYAGFALAAVPEEDPLRSDLLEIRNAGERGAELTRQLLAFSRQQILQPVTLNLNDVARNFEGLLRRVLGEDIELILVLAPDVGTTRADPGQIERVLMNLVVNARDAMPMGGKLTIQTANVDLVEEAAAQGLGLGLGSYVQLVVTDTGCGMDESTRARLFEPFFTTKERGKGTGLGLSTVYGIVTQSGGNVWVYSEPDRGTTFKVYLPREPSSSAPVQAPSRLSRGRLEGTETVLLVEDEDALREAARRGLAAAGYNVLAAGGASEALDICARYQGDIHLLLTDVVLTDLGGGALAIRLATARPGLRVLYMSGYPGEAVGQHGVLDGGTHFLAKPFTPTELVVKVREVLDGPIATPGSGGMS